MQKMLSLLVFFLFSNIIIAQEKSPINFPENYLGKYIGTLDIFSEKGKTEYPMEFHLLATDSVGKYKYTLVYGDGENRQERPYTLIEKDKQKGNYVLDENNGITLDAKVNENKMYFLFEVMDSLLTTFITFEKDHLIFEIVVTNTKKKNVSGGQNDSIPKVSSYPIHVVQKARLIKQ